MVYLKDHKDLALELAENKYDKKALNNDISFPFEYVEKALEEYHDLNYNRRTGEVRKGDMFVAGYSSPTDIPLEWSIEDIITYQFLPIIFSVASSRHYYNI